MLQSTSSSCTNEAIFCSLNINSFFSLARFANERETTKSHLFRSFSILRVCSTYRLGLRRVGSALFIPLIKKKRRISNHHWIGRMYTNLYLDEMWLCARVRDLYFGSVSNRIQPNPHSAPPQRIPVFCAESIASFWYLAISTLGEYAPSFPRLLSSFSRDTSHPPIPWSHRPPTNHNFLPIYLVFARNYLQICRRRWYTCDFGARLYGES